MVPGGLARQLSAPRCGKVKTFEPRVWYTEERRRSFGTQFWATARLILICLVSAFAAEYALSAVLTPGALAACFGEDQWWAIPAGLCRCSCLYRRLCGAAVHTGLDRKWHVRRGSAA